MAQDLVAHLATAGIRGSKDSDSKIMGISGVLSKILVDVKICVMYQGSEFQPTLLGRSFA